MCYTYPTVETKEIAGEHTLTGIEHGTDQDSDMWWLHDGSKYVLFELDGQPYQMVGGGRSYFDEKYGFQALWKVDNGRRPDNRFEPIKVNVTATEKSLLVTRADTGQVIFDAGEDRPDSFRVRTFPEAMKMPTEETLSPPQVERVKELAAV